jgi:hypothetical protein
MSAFVWRKEDKYRRFRSIFLDKVYTLLKENDGKENDMYE